jgi:Holliday junction DNA helicase RuvA
MIGHLRGKPIAVTAEKILLDVGGVGYELHITLPTYGAVERAGGDRPIGLFVHTHVRADAIELFGFWTERERELFELLIGVGGIGPRLARVVLSGMPVGELLAALAAGDLARLGTISGVGKKTAQRMIVELKDRVRELAPDLEPDALPAAETDLVQALLNLGYKAGEAERALAKARIEHPDADAEEMLRASLKLLSRA